MADDVPSPFEPTASAGEADEVENAQWLAALIAALQNQAESRGHPEIAAALNGALAAAQAIVDGDKRH